MGGFGASGPLVPRRQGDSARGPFKYHYRYTQQESQREFLKLDLGGQCFRSMEWLLKALNLESRWWKMHCGQVQLLKELHQAIDATRQRKRKLRVGDGTSRVPARNHIAVAFMIRGEEVVLLNKPLAMALLIRPGEKEKTIKWLIKEIVPDIKLLIEKPSEIAAAEANQEKEGRMMRRRRPKWTSSWCLQSLGQIGLQWQTSSVTSKGASRS